MLSAQPEHHTQWRIIDFCSGIVGSLGGDWMQTIINDVLDVF
jgi:hypothetical protein